jgi:hypothetical protein
MDAMPKLEVAEIEGRNWLHVQYKICIIFFKMLHEMNKRKKETKIPWSNKKVYFGMLLKLALPEEESNYEV